MRRLFFTLLLLLTFVLPAQAAEEIIVGVTPFPHKDILLQTKDLLAKDGYTLVLKEFTDYVQPIWLWPARYFLPISSSTNPTWKI